MAKRPRRTQTLLVQDRYFTKGSVVTFGAFLGVLLTLGTILGYAIRGVVAVQHVLEATQATLDKHTDLIQRETTDFNNFKGDFKAKVDDDSKQRENLRATFLENSAKTTQGIADLNTRAAKTETAQDFLNKQVGDVVQQLKTLTEIVARNSTPLTGRR